MASFIKIGGKLINLGTIASIWREGAIVKTYDGSTNYIHFLTEEDAIAAFKNLEANLDVVVFDNYF